jgi:hypothetical protein
MEPLQVTQRPLESLLSVAQQGRLYAMVDSAREDVGNSVDYLPSDARAVRILPREGNDPSGFPWLVELQTAHLPWLGARTSTDPWGILLQSDSVLELLAAGLGRALTAIDADGEEVIVRFYDPRVLPSLLRSCASSELGRWYAEVDSYGVLHSDGVHWYTAVGKRQSFPAADEPLLLNNLHLGAFQRVEEDVLLANILDFLQLEGLDLETERDDPTMQTMLRHGLATARSYGLVQLTDLAAFLALMFDVSPNFHLQPAIHRVLADPDRPPSRRLHNAIASTSDSDWEEAAASYDWRAWFAPDATSSYDEGNIEDALSPSGSTGSQTTGVLPSIPVVYPYA